MFLRRDRPVFYDRWPPSFWLGVICLAGGVIAATGALVLT